jgi:nicotinate-nucleotide adenylyltransferase
VSLRRDPQAYAGMRIGLFGGSFDPAHSGHRHVADVALRALQLDRVWWLVTPQNPLKPKSMPLAKRMASAREVARGGRNVVTEIESRIGTRYSVDTISALQRRYPGVQFVWIVGGDVLGEMHRWRRWRAIFRALPIAVVARDRVAARQMHAPAFARFAEARLPAHQAGRLAQAPPPAWVFLPGRLNPFSSTQLRNRKP